MTLPSITSIRTSTRRPCSYPWRTERGQCLIYSFRSLSGFTCSFSFPHPFSLTGPLNPLSSWPSKVKSSRKVPAKSHRRHRALPPKSLVHSTIAFGVVYWERKDGGSAGSRVHVPLSSLPVSIWHGYMREYSSVLTFRNAGLNSLVIFIPLAWVSHFHEWTHGLTFARMP